MKGPYSIVFSGRTYSGGRELITPGDTATGITASLRAPTSGAQKGRNARAAIIQNKGTGNATFCIDGTTPTNAAGTNRGFLLLANGAGTYTIEGEDEVKNFKVVDTVSGTASIVEVLLFF